MKHDFDEPALSLILYLSKFAGTWNSFIHPTSTDRAPTTRQAHSSGQNPYGLRGLPLCGQIQQLSSNWDMPPNRKIKAMNLLHLQTRWRWSILSLGRTCAEGWHLNSQLLEGAALTSLHEGPRGAPLYSRKGPQSNPLLSLSRGGGRGLPH